MHRLGVDILEVYMPVLPETDRVFTFTTGPDTFSIGIMAVLAVGLVAVGKHIVLLAMAEEIDDMKEVLNTLLANWQLALVLVDKLRATHEELDKGTPNLKHQKLQCEALDFCGKVVVSCLEAALGGIRKAFGASFAVLEKLTKETEIVELFRLVELAAPKGSFDSVPSDFMSIAGTKTAVELFEAFTDFHKHTTMSQKLLQVVGVARSKALQQPIKQTIEDHKAWVDGEISNKQRSIEEAGRAMGTLTGLQALLRPLEPGESRQMLADKVIQGLPRRKFLSMHAAVDTALRGVAGVAAT